MKKRILSLVFVLMVLFFILSSTNLLLREKTREIKKISVIIPEDDSSVFEDFRRGIQEAANEERVEINYITLGKERGAVTQSELVERENQGGAQAVILEVKDPEGLTEYLEGEEALAPLITVNSSGAYPFQTCGIVFDFESAAERLVQKIREEEGQTARVVCVKREKKRSEEMCRTLREKLTESGMESREIGLVQLKEEGGENEVYVGCGPEETEAILRTVREAEAVYGIGHTSALLKEMEEGRLGGVVTGSMYSMGVHAVRAAVGAIEGKETERNISVPMRLITGENLKEEQKFLFPIH